MPEYFSFEDVLGELQLDEEELKRMVSEGELRAFRDENKMKFRKDDVENLKKGRITEPTIVLPTPARGSDKPTQEEGETILDFASDASGSAIRPDETAVPAIDVGAGTSGETTSDTGSETAAGETTGITEEMIFEDSDLTVPKEEGTGTALEAQQTQVEDSGTGEQTTGLTTEPLKIDEGSGTGTDEGSGTQEGEAEQQEEAAPRQRRAPRQVPVSAPVKGSPAFTAMLCVSALVLVMAGVVVGEYMMIDPSKSDRPSGLSHAIAGFFLKFTADEQMQKDWEALAPTK
ncbi:MAG: hypothetical protein HYZ53_05165 [Planctomycetes bacterium]|nr:hypothetical protein [Planctomycetota bacterium]